MSNLETRSRNEEIVVRRAGETRRFLIAGVKQRDIPKKMSLLL